MLLDERSDSRKWLRTIDLNDGEVAFGSLLFDVGREERIAVKPIASCPGGIARVVPAR